MIDDLEVAHLNPSEFWPSTWLVSRDDLRFGALPVDQDIIRQDFFEDGGVGAKLGLTQALFKRGDLFYGIHGGIFTTLRQTQRANSD